MAETVDYFIPPDIGKASVLAHDLTPLPTNACDAFIHAYVPDGGLVWDPFCRTDTVAQVAMRQGKRAFLSDHNPLIAFAVRASLLRVSARQFDRAFETLAALPTMQTTLANHINSLYATTCPDCASPAIARSFLWTREKNQPVSKEFYCLTCNRMRQDAVAEADLALASRIEEHGRAYWALLERLGASDGPLHLLAESLLDLYTPRSLYALSMIQSKLDVADMDRDVMDVLTLALLDTMEQGIKRNIDDRGQRQRIGLTRPVAGGRAPSEQPLLFIETNCWQTFADACSAQRERLARLSREGDVQRALTPSLKTRPTGAKERAPEAGAVVVRQASVQRAASDLAEGSVDLILACPPLIDWGDMLPLTYLWTGWLLGKDEARLFSPEYLLHPRRANDWAWFYTAMERGCRAMAATLKPDGKVVFCFPLGGLGYVNVLVLAATAGGLCLENIAYQPNNPEALRHPPALGATAGYCYLRFARVGVAPPTGEDLPQTVRSESVAAAVGLIRERGEPAAYIWLHLAAILRLGQAGLLARLVAPSGGESPVWERLRMVQAAIEQANGAQLVFLPWAAAEGVSADSGDAEGTHPLARQRGWWWLADESSAATCISDRIEWATYTVLSTSQLTTRQAVNRVVYALFPGLLTPEPGLIEACLESYACPASPLHWQLRREDALADRSREHLDMLVLLTNLGHRLGFRVWIGHPDRHNRHHGSQLVDLLSLAERYKAIEDILADAGEHSQLIDIVWYRNRQASHIFEVEWTAMLGESVLRRGSRLPGVARFVVVPPERAALLVVKQERQPLLRWRLHEDGWRFIRFDALRDLADAEAPSLADLERLSGLERPAQDKGVQLTLL